jgi:LysM repeat protein
VFLIAVIAGTYVVVHHGVKQITQNTTTSTTSTRPVKPPLTRKQRKYARQKFYVVKSGDSLTAIASKTGQTVAKLQALNPRINPNSLQLGQRIRLRR